MRKTITVLFLALVLAFSIVGCGDGSSSRDGSSGINKYAGNWQGTWTIQETSENGTISMTISNSGLITGVLTNSYGESTIKFSGQVKGSNVSFTYQYSGGPQVTASGIFGEIMNNQVQVTFTMNYSGNIAHGTCNLMKKSGGNGNSTLTITTIAGTGNYGYSGDGGPATNANLSVLYGVAVDASGNVYIADEQNNRIRKVTTAGNITTIAGNGNFGYGGDGGPAVNANLAWPKGVAVDTAGNIYIVDSENDRIRKVNTSGIITTIAGNGEHCYSGDNNGDGDLAINAKLSWPEGVAVDAIGNIYIANTWNYCIRKVDTSGIITTIAGNGNQGYNGDGGPATNAELFLPTSVAADVFGNVYIADCGTLYISDNGNHRIRKVDTSGRISTIAGNGTKGYSGDGGPATNANLYNPTGVAVDNFGNIYIADYSNNRIRKVDTSGIITTIAGNGTSGYSGDGGSATSAKLSAPYGIAVDITGKIYFSDLGNGRIRKLQ